MNRKEAEDYLSKLSAKLSRIRNYVIAKSRRDPLTNKLAMEHQYAVRILESAARELNRCYQIDYGTNKELIAACLAEQKLQRRDRGEILPFSGRNHSVGRFTCQACDFDYVDDPLGGMPIRRPNSRLCVFCGAGVQHSAVVVSSPTKVVEAVLSDSGILGSIPGSETAPEPNVSDVEALQRVYLCDSCGKAESIALPTVG